MYKHMKGVPQVSHDAPGRTAQEALRKEGRFSTKPKGQKEASYKLWTEKERTPPEWKE